MMILDMESQQIINNLNELQKLVDVNYRLTKYYLLIIKNGYEPKI